MNKNPRRIKPKRYRHRGILIESIPGTPLWAMNGRNNDRITAPSISALRKFIDRSWGYGA